MFAVRLVLASGRFLVVIVVLASGLFLVAFVVSALVL